MKKKIGIAVLVVALLVPAMAFATMFDISLGATAQFGKNPADTNFNWGSLGKIENWTFGGEARFKITILEIDAVGLYNRTGNDDIISGMVTAGLAFDIFDVVRLGVGMGPNLAWNITQKSVYTVDASGNNVLLTGGNFADAFMGAPMNYRATVDFLLGKNFMIGVNYQVPSTFTFKNLIAKDLMPQWQNGRYGVSVLFSFF